MRYLLFALLIACGQPEIEEKKERELIVYVCYNPGSIWHLSECNEECTRRDYTGEAFCLALFDTVCETSGDLFIRRACGLYYR